MKKIRNILIITVIAALVPTAMSSVSTSASAEIALFSSDSDSDGLSISGSGDGERPLFGGRISDGNSSSDSTSESFSLPSQREHIDEGVNTFGSDEAKEGTPVVYIDPASSDSLKVLSQRVGTDEILDNPTMNINGEIQNSGTQSLDFVKTNATFYDMNNQVIGSDFTYTKPDTLEPGQTAPFKLTAGYGDDLPVDEIANIKLHVSGEAGETLMPASGGEQGDKQQFSSYADPDRRFTIDYPSEWYVNEEPSDEKESAVQFDSTYDPDTIEGGITNEDLTMPSVRVFIRNAEPDETSLESLTNKKVNDLAQATTIQESEPVTLSGLPAHTIKTMGGLVDNPHKQVWALHDGKVFQILYMAHPYDYENYVSDFERMVEFFRFTG
jgi:hypothetical protein